uniref:Uncharacterized protein n=1 Tax=Arion vulgaris TaxID=1028688 RepID=A0A0B7BDV3_9EUPU
MMNRKVWLSRWVTSEAFPTPSAEILLYIYMIALSDFSSVIEVTIARFLTNCS